MLIYFFKYLHIRVDAPKYIMSSSSTYFLYILHINFFLNFRTSQIPKFTQIYTFAQCIFREPKSQNFNSTIDFVKNLT